MSWLDYLLLALIGGYCAYLLLRRKKKDGCCGARDRLSWLLPAPAERKRERKVRPSLWH